MEGLVNSSRCCLAMSCLLLICTLSATSCKKSKPSPETLAQNDFECQIEFLRSHATDDLKNYYPEKFGRTKEAIEMLSNGVLDEKVIILDAYVDKSPGQYRPPPTVGTGPRLILFAVEEAKRVAYINYSESSDPNAFGEPMFELWNYYYMFPPQLGDYFHPIYFLELYLKSYGIDRFNLLKVQQYLCTYPVLEAPQSRFESLVANRGQIILCDRSGKLLDRFKLRPRPKNMESEHLEEPVF